MAQTSGYFQWYATADQGALVKGADVANYQYPINWATMYAAGARFVIMKAGGANVSSYSARYIKITVNTNSAGLSAIFNELKVYNTSLVEVAQGKTVTGSAGTPDSGSYSYVTDNITTNSVNVGINTQWVKVDLASAVDVRYIRLWTYPNVTFHHLKVEYSTDDVLYTTIYDSDQAGTGEYKETTDGAIIITSGVTTYSQNSQMLAANIAAARAAGLKVGFYWFKNPNYYDVPNLTWHNTTTDAQTEADLFKLYIDNELGGGDYGDIHPVLDWENNYGNVYPAVTNDTAYDFIEAFANRIKSTTGKQLMLYTAYYTNDTLAPTGVELVHSTKGGVGQIVPLWLSANYISTYPTSAWNYTAFGGWTGDKWAAWQYSSDGNALGSTYGVSSADIDLDFAESLDYITTPSAPTGLTATATSPYSIQLDWNTTTNVSVNGYKVYTSGGTLVTTITNPATSSYFIDGLTENTSYGYKVTVTTKYEESAFSSTASATTDAIANNQPASSNGITAQLVVFDRDENLVAILTNDSPSACPFWDATHTEQINGTNTLVFTAPSEHADAAYLVEENLVAYKNPNESYWQLFNIRQVDDEHGGELTKTVTCDHASGELLDDFITSYNPTSEAANNVLSTLLNGTRWLVGNVDSLGTHDETFSYQSVRSALNQAVGTWGGELQFRVVISGNAVMYRYIDWLSSRGTDTGARFEFTRNLETVKRTVDSTNVKTALYGRGKGIDGNDGTGSQTTFSTITWTTPTNPANKPNGQEWVGDDAAKALYGRPDGLGGYRHRYGVYDIDEGNPATLLQKTWDYLQTVNTPSIEYDVSVADLGSLTGYENLQVLLGDTVRVVDYEFSPAVTVSARIIELVRHLDEPDKTEIKLGNYIPQIADTTTQVQSINDTLTNKSGQWDNKIGKGFAIDAAQNEVNAGTGSVKITDTDGIIIVDNPTAPTKALRLLGGVWGISNSKDGSGNWVWSTVADGDGIVADLITSGTMTADRISGGTLVLGGANNVNGLFQVVDSNGKVRIRADQTGLYTLNASGYTTFFVNNNGDVSIGDSSQGNPGGGIFPFIFDLNGLPNSPNRNFGALGQWYGGIGVQSKNNWQANFNDAFCVKTNDGTLLLNIDHYGDFYRNGKRVWDTTYLKFFKVTSTSGGWVTVTYGNTMTGAGGTGTPTVVASAVGSAARYAGVQNVTTTSCQVCQSGTNTGDVLVVVIGTLPL